AVVAPRNLGRAVGKVAKVAGGGPHDEVGPEVAGDRPRLRRRLHDYQSLRHRRVTIATPQAEYSSGAPAAPVPRHRRAELARPLRRLPAACPRAGEPARDGRLRPRLQPPLEPRPVAAGAPALAAPLAPLHGEIGALLVAAPL